MARLLRGRARGRGGDRRARRRHAARARSRPRATRRPRRAAAAARRAAARPAAPPGRRPNPGVTLAARSSVDGWEVAPPARPRLRQRRAGQGPVRGPARRAAAGRRSFAVDCGGDLRFGGPRAQARGRRPVRRPAAARVRARRRRRRHERDRPAQLARRRRPPRAPPARPRDRRARVHRRRPGDRARADRRRGRVARQGRGAERAGRAAGWLAHGGVVVLDDGSHRVVPNPRITSTGGTP